MTRLCYYGTEAEVQAACDKIFTNMLRAKAEAGDGTLYENPPTATKITVSEKSDSELLNVPLLGNKSGSLNKSGGFTTAWDIPKQCYDDNTKYWAEINSEMNTGVTCGTAEYSSDWTPPPEEVAA